MNLPSTDTLHPESEMDTSRSVTPISAATAAAHSANRPFDLVVLGASGFTGRFVVAHLAQNAARISADLGHTLTWAAAGRSHSRVQAVVDEFAARVPVIEADVFDQAALLALARQATVLINCVGPFRFYGAPVVQACVDAGTSYVDITGEPDFIDRMYIAHHDTAKASGIMVVPACGFDSMPADLGVLYTKAKMLSNNIIPAHIEMFLTLNTGPAGFVGHFATYESAVHGFGNLGSLRSMRKSLTALRPRSVPLTDANLRLSIRPAYNPRLARYTLPFPGSDATVVRMGQDVVAHLELPDALPSVQFAAYVAINRWWNVAGVALFGTVLGGLAKYKWGRWLLLKFPRFWSGGMFSHAGPTKLQLETTSFTETFIGRGFALDPVNVPAESDLRDHVLRAGGNPVERDAVRAALVGREMDAEIVTKVSGPEPGYVATPRFVVAAAVTILAEKQTAQLPSGVLTPASAFFRSGIINRLRADGIEFSVAAVRRSR